MEKRFAVIVEEKVSIDFVQIVGPGTAARECAHQHIGPVSIRARLIVLDENVVANDRGSRFGGHTWNFRDGDLVLNLHVVADGVLDQIVLDYAIDEWLSSIGVTQINAGPALQ